MLAIGSELIDLILVKDPHTHSFLVCPNPEGDEPRRMHAHTQAETDRHMHRHTLMH